MARPPRVTILDGFVDEPANFGVPPYVSPHARYVAGAARAADPNAQVTYLTVEEWRRLRGHKFLPDEGTPHLAKSKPQAHPAHDPSPSKRTEVEEADLLVVVAGALVPGKYVRGTPISWREARIAANECRGETIIAGSSAIYGFGRGGGHAPAGRKELDKVFDYRALLHADALVHDKLTGAVGDKRFGINRKRTLEEWADWSVRGADVAAQHPDHPHPLIAEIDTYHGCVRYVNGGCAFCMEPKEGKPEFRPVEDVVAEVAALAKAGVKSFRIGGQACFYSFHATGLGETATPAPNPAAIETLLTGIHRVCPDIHTLHLDNVDPAVIAANPEESRAVTKLVVEHMTDGNIAAFGVESADPAVIRENNLNAAPKEIYEAAAILNEYGAKRGAHGQPAFLPGLNFICGLPGETAESYEHNKRFLQEYVDRGLLARRINIRKVVEDGHEVEVPRKRFQAFKQWVREEIDRPMLRKLYPEGTLLKRVFVEHHDGAGPRGGVGVSFGRPTGTYAMLIGVPYEVPIGEEVDVAVTGHGYRSLTGVRVPFPVNEAKLKQLSALPGVGKKRAGRLAVKRPFRSADDLRAALDDPDLADRLAPIMTYA